MNGHKSFNNPRTYSLAVRNKIRSAFAWRIFAGTLWPILLIYLFLLLFRSSHFRFILLFACYNLIRSTQLTGIFNSSLEIPHTFFLSFEIKKLPWPLGLTQVVVVIGLFVYYINAFDLLCTLTDEKLNYGFLNMTILLCGLYDVFGFYLGREYVMEMRLVNVGRIRYLRSVALKSLAEVSLGRA
eukprot:TRINITY_DN10061_c0_g1_i2.p1 TRINITY_DN10061_c0_g1~~TRINITY_DN10061_c0_g1_i2.p1  ORF type:complete len:184 (+),score=5.59 TRINITY_DN10061_c0_g1_i2:200-751(+)